jgi:hypothetical protein
VCLVTHLALHQLLLLLWVSWRVVLTPYADDMANHTLTAAAAVRAA